MRRRFAAPPSVERQGLKRKRFGEVQRYLAGQGIEVSRGTIVDATIVSARSSTKNREKKCDPEMHHTRKGQQWYFEMKGHFGVHSRTKLVHSVAVSAANVADARVLPELLHGGETRIWGDQAYRGQRERIRRCALRARDFTDHRYRHRGRVDEVERAESRTKSRVRAKAEHPIGLIKRVAGSPLRQDSCHLYRTCNLRGREVTRWPDTDKPSKTKPLLGCCHRRALRWR